MVVQEKLQSVKGKHLCMPKLIIDVKLRVEIFKQICVLFQCQGTVKTTESLKSTTNLTLDF